MRRTFLLKSMLLLCALIAGSSSVWGAEGDVTVTVNYGDIPEGYDSNGTSGSITKTVKTNNDLTINYAGINTKSSSASTATIYSYAMFLENKGYVYSSVAPTGYYPSKVKVTFSSGTGEKGKAGITYGTTALNSRNTSVSGAVSKSGTCELTNTDQTKLYWNFSTSTKNVQVDKIEVTYSLKAGVNPPTFSPAAGEVIKGSTVTLTQAVADQIRYTLDGSAPTRTTGTVYSAPIVINEPTTIKAIAIKGDDVSGVSEATYTVVYPAVVTLDFTDSGWGFPTEYDTSEKSYAMDGYTVTLGEAGTGHKVVMESGSSTKIASLIFGKKDATLTLPALGFNVSKLKVYGNSSASGAVTFNVYVGTTAVSTEVTSSKVTQEFTIAADKQDVGTIYTIKVTNANNCQISKIEVFGNGCEAREVTSFGWATYVAQNDMKFPAGRAYVVTNASVGNAITKAEVTDVPAGTPVLLKDEGAVTAMLLDAAPAAPATNMLSVCDGTIASGKYAYVLAKKDKTNNIAGFMQWTGDAADLTNRVVMLLDQAVEAPAFIPLDGETTGINTVNGSGFMFNGSEVYNLNGQRVAQPTKGLYIVNGRKVVIK